MKILDAGEKMEVKKVRKTIGFSVKLDDYVRIHNIIEDSRKDWEVICKDKKPEIKHCLKGDMLVYLIQHGRNTLKELRAKKEGKES